MGTLSDSHFGRLTFDEDGFLTQPELWNRNVADLLAREEIPGELTEDHWKIVDYLRQYYDRFHTLPSIRMVRKSTNCDVKCLYRLFPSGLSRGACRVAGIPKSNCWMFDAYGGL